MDNQAVQLIVWLKGGAGTRQTLRFSSTITPQANPQPEQGYRQELHGAGANIWDVAVASNLSAVGSTVKSVSGKLISALDFWDDLVTSPHADQF